MFNIQFSQTDAAHNTLEVVKYYLHVGELPAGADRAPIDAALLTELLQECDKALRIVEAQASRHASAVAALDRPFAFSSKPWHQHAKAWKQARDEYIGWRIADAEARGVSWSYGDLVMDFVEEFRRREVEGKDKAEKRHDCLCS